MASVKKAEARVAELEVRRTALAARVPELERDDARLSQALAAALAAGTSPNGERDERRKTREELEDARAALPLLDEQIKGARLELDAQVRLAHIENVNRLFPDAIKANQALDRALVQFIKAIRDRQELAAAIASEAQAAGIQPHQYRLERSLPRWVYTRLRPVLGDGDVMIEREWLRGDGTRFEEIDQASHNPITIGGDK